MGSGGSGFPCISRDPAPQLASASDLPTVHSPYDETPEGLSSAHFRALLLRTASLDAFFRSSMREQLLAAHSPEFLVQFPASDDLVLLLSRRAVEDTERILVLPFVFLGQRSGYRDCLEHALARYQNAQRLETLGGGRDGRGLFLLFRSRLSYGAELQVVELPGNISALDLEERLNRDVRGSHMFRAAISTKEALFLVLHESGLATNSGSFLVLEVPSSLEGLLAALEQNEGSQHMCLLGLVPSTHRLFLIYFYA